MKNLKLIVYLFVCIYPAYVHAQSEQPSPILITEVYYNTPGDDSISEWVEVANLSGEPIDLTDYSIGDAEIAGDYEGMHRFPPGSTLDAGKAVVVAQTAVSFYQQFGFKPDYEITDSDPEVPDMRGYPLWANGELRLANDGDELLLMEKLSIIDTINYGDSEVFFSPAINGVLKGQSIERVPANCDTNSAAGWIPRAQPSPGKIMLDGDCPVPQNPAETKPLQPIGDIQGAGESSPYVNQMVSFRGIITGIQSDQNVAGTTYYTIFVQDIPDKEDGNPMTSDAIAVFLGWQRPFFQIGDQVLVKGLVTEFFGLTEIDSDGLEVTVEVNNQPLPDPVFLGAKEITMEALEGMLVALPEARVIGPTHAACGFTVVASDGPQRIFKRSKADATDDIIPILNHTDINCDGFPQVKTGDTITGLAGPLTYHFDQFKIVQQNIDLLDVTAVPFQPPPNPIPTSPGFISIATLNMENHFDALDDTGSDAEPKPSSADISLRQAKLAYAIHEILSCPTIIGVQEVEKESLLEALAEELTVPCGFKYTVTHFESPDVRGIDVALLSDPTLVQVQSARLQQGCSPLKTGIQDETAVCQSNQSPLFSRPPLEANLNLAGSDFVIYVNHFKSKRGGEEATAPRRLAQAQHLADLIDTQLNSKPDTHIIVLGDFNDYEDSSPLKLLTQNGRLINSLLQIPDSKRYSYNFNGISQLIDGILVSPSLTKHIIEVNIHHVNADFPSAFSHDISANHLPYKSTDHDLPLLVLEIPTTQQTPITLNPTNQPTPEPTKISANLPQKTQTQHNPWLLLTIILGGTAVIGVMAVALHRYSE